MISFLFHQLPGILIGLVVGAFIPGVLRKFHAWVSKEENKGVQFAEYVYKDVEKKL